MSDLIVSPFAILKREQRAANRYAIGAAGLRPPMRRSVPS